MHLRLRHHLFHFPRPSLIMGIVNLGADSFSGDGLPDPDAALAHARQLVADGADLIDVGVESARTNRGPISEDDEAAQFLRFLDRWQADPPHDADGSSVPLSLNTWRPAVVRQLLPRGGDLLNDIGALPTDENARLCAGHGAALLIMHTVGQPKVPHIHVAYDDIMARLDGFFAEKLALCARAGLPSDATILDPGIDFAKQRDDNLRIYREFDRLHHFVRPILLPVSRKTVIGDVLGLPAPERDPGTVACIAAALQRGAHIIRVHNVRAASQTLRTLTPLLPTLQSSEAPATP